MKKGDEFFKNIKPRKSLLISGIIIIILSILLGLLFTCSHLNKEATPFENVYDSNIYANLQVIGVTDYFATLDEDGITKKMYIVITEDNIFIANIDSDTFAKLQDIYNYTYSEDENAIAPEPVTISGYSKTIPSEVFEYAKEYIFKEEDVSDSDFRNALGYFYLDTYENPSEDVIYIAIFFALIALIGIILVIIYFIRNKKTKKKIEKNQEELEKISLEIENKEAIHNKICKAYLTNKYLINYATGLDLIELKDIVWIYPYEYRQNGIVIQKSVYVITNNSKANVVASISAWVKKNKMAYDEFYQDFMNKTPDALHGYSKGNKEKAKECIKDN